MGFDTLDLGQRETPLDPLLNPRFRIETRFA